MHEKALFHEQSDAKNEGIESLDDFGLKEFTKMLEEMKEDQASVRAAIEEALMAPIPDEDDAEATALYKARMLAVRDLSNRLLGKDSAIAEFEERIDISKSSPNERVDK